MTGSMACTEEVYAEQAKFREDELMALEAILPSSDWGRSMSFGSSERQEIWLNVPILLPGPTTIAVESHYIVPKSTKAGDADGVQSGEGIESTSATANDEKKTTLLEGICHLPPLNVLLRLPRGYPAYEPPTIVRITSDMITQTQRNRPYSNKGREANNRVASLARAWRASLIDWLRDALMKQWQDFQGEILYTWYELLKEALWQDVLAPNSTIDCPLLRGSPAILTFVEFLVEEPGSLTESPLAASLKAHDLLCKRKQFEGERFGCGICLEEMRGRKCWKIADCGHVFCQDCLTSYLSSMIREGYIRQASACPDPECVKARVAVENKEAAREYPIDSSENVLTQVGTISSAELQQFVGQELVARLEDLRERALASTDPSAGYCPRPGCEKLVRGDAKDIGTMYESMRMCDCGFIYCLYCNKAWHGKAPCNLLSSTALIERYQKAAEGSTTRREMELRYGKANLERMVRNHEEETQNRAYIESNTQRCPCCSVRIEKSMGCNHMTCRSCHTHLCYRCGTRLNPNEPYRHFNTPGAPCFQKLFDVDMGGAGGAPNDWGFPGAQEDDLVEWEAEL